MPDNKASAIARPYAGGKQGSLRAIKPQRPPLLWLRMNQCRSAQKVAIYAYVSSAEHRTNLERQVERLLQYCESRGYQVSQVVKEIAPGVNDSRPKLLSLLKDTSTTLLVVEHRDRLTRFGFHYLETLLEAQRLTIEVITMAENDKEDLIADLVAFVSSFTVRLYVQRRAKRKTERMFQELEAEDATR